MGHRARPRPARHPENRKVIKKGHKKKDEEGRVRNGLIGWVEDWEKGLDGRGRSRGPVKSENGMDERKKKRAKRKGQLESMSRIQTGRPVDLPFFPQTKRRAKLPFRLEEKNRGLFASHRGERITGLGLQP